MGLAYRNERQIVDDIKLIRDSEICFYPGESDLVHRALESLRGDTLTQRERPDFEDLKHSLVLEAMRVDDHPRPGKKDATRAREGAVLRELRETGIFEMFPNASLVASVNSGLPTKQDHNYQAYLKQFASVVGDHATNTVAYRAERPGFDLGFLVFDESTAYVETVAATGHAHCGRPHAWFSDAAFLDVVQAANIDYIAWMTPYKRILNGEGGHHALPQLTIVDTSLLDDNAKNLYDEKRMKSAEL